MDSIRVRYSGLVAFLARFLSLLTGFVFTLIVTNRLSEQDFGIWQLVQNSHSYTLFLAAIISYWTVRSVAQGKGAGKTSLALALLLSAPASAIYLAVSFYYSVYLDIDFVYFVLGWFQIPILFLVISGEAISSGAKPQVQSYAFIAAEILKISLAIPFLVMTNLGLPIVITIIILTDLAQLAMLVYLTRDQLKAGFDRKLAKYWMKLSWLPMTSAIPGLIATFDVVVVSSLLKSVEVIAFFKAAFLLANFVTYGQYIAIGLYPKIIQGPSSKDIQSVLQLILMLVIPLAVAIFVMSQPLLHLLRSSYADSHIALLILIPSSIAIVFYLFFDSIIMGTDNVEKSGSASIREVLKSRLFLIPKIGIAYSSSYLAVLAGSIFLLGDNNSNSYSTVATIWAIATLVSIVPFTIYKGVVARSILNFSISLNSIAKYAGGSFLMALALYFMNTFFLDYGLPKIEYAIFILAESAVAAGLYFVVLYVIDPEFKNLLREIIRRLLAFNR